MTDHRELRERLDHIEHEARGILVARRARRAFDRALHLAPALLCLLPGSLLCLNLFAWVGGLPGYTLHAPVLVVLCFVIPVFWIVGCLLVDRLRPLPRGAALRFWDDEHQLKDRLVAAREFLRAPERTPFMEATLDDAEDQLERLSADEAAPSLGDLWTTPSAGAYRWMASAMLLAILALILTPEGMEVEEREDHVKAPQSRSTKGAAPMPEAKTPERKPERPPVPKERPAPPEPQKLPPAKAGEESRAESADVPRPWRRSTGSTGSGESAQATDPSASSPAQGAPSGQGAPSKGRPKSQPKKASKPSKPKEAEPQPRKKGQEGSGATAGRGKGKGSGRNPVATPWKSKDQVSSDNEDELEQDDDVDDDDSDSESRGGMQPNLRDRRPPVSRELGIGFGNQANEDANGRGGPSQQKKSRGTASLVLGVPIPDHVKGRPNPGRTKITQERVQPRQEKSPRVAAEPRRRGGRSTGPLVRPGAEPWLRELIRNYFVERRARGAAATKEERGAR